MENTKIEWATHTFNPWIGCSKVHAGCLNCYAETLMADRYGKVVWGPNGTRKLTSAAKWREPVRWNKQAEGLAERPRVFCASLADVFEDWDGPILNSKGEEIMADVYADEPLTMDGARTNLFQLIDATPNLDWLILTKRPENIRRMWPDCQDDGVIDPKWRHNVWLLTSVSNQETYEKQWPELAKCRDLAPILGISAEPLLGPIDLADTVCDLCHGHGVILMPKRLIECHHCDGKGLTGGPDWIIAGGESGRDARPCCVEWIDDLRCRASLAEVPFFAKQLGANPVTTNANFYDFPAADETDWGTAAASCGYVLNDPKGGDWDEWPEELRVRQFPNG